MFSLKNITKLIERKENYLQRLIGEGSDQRRIDAVRSEINIIREFIEDAVSEIDATAAMMREVIKQFENIEATKDCLEMICLLHGINDFAAWAVKGREWLFYEVSEQQKEMYLYIPEQLKKLYEIK